MTKLRASDGALLGTYVGGEDANRADGLVFDGTYMWVANGLASTVTKLQPSDGTIAFFFKERRAEGQAEHSQRPYRHHL